MRKAEGEVARVTDVGRFARTVRGLHPLQIATRPARPLLRAVARLVANAAPAPLRDGLAAPPAALVALAESERARAAERLERLPAGSLLRAYEAAYGHELGAATGAPSAAWSSQVASEPFPASVRARRIALAVRFGDRSLGLELARAARAVAAQLELHLLANHLLENAFGLACAGAVARGAEADAWYALGAALLAWQLDEQFLPDGGHFERSASYHLALTAALLETIELARVSGRALPARWRSAARRALAFAAAVRAPDGTVPLFNDATLDAAPAADEVLALGEALGLASPVAPVVAPSARVLADTGWTLLDADDGARAVVDTGPDGAPYQPGHVHADPLTFELWIDGRRAVVDFGVASYAWDEARRETRATRSHNTLELDELDACEVWGAFRVGRRASARVLDAGAKDGTAFVVAEHDGYAWLPGAPRHRRTMRLRAGTLDIDDELVGGWRGEAVSRLRVASEVAPHVRVEAAPGPCETTEGAWYPRFGERHAARIFAQRMPASEPRRLRWSIRW